MAILKNTVISGTDSIFLPNGTTSQRPSTPTDGDFRFNTDLGWPEYFYKGFWINANTNSGGITHRGCVCLLDIGNPNSYAGTGSTIIDVSGNGNNGIITGSPTFSTANGRHLSGNGATQYIRIALNVDNLYPMHTVVTVCGYNGSSRGRITTTYSNNWLLGHWSAGDVRYFAEGWVSLETSSGGGAANDQWGVHVGTGDKTNDQWAYYKNGTLHRQSDGGAQGPTTIQIGSQAQIEPSNWKWQLLAVYNRRLGPEEIRDTTAAIRLRGGF
jgi:hypothetical protein